MGWKVGYDVYVYVLARVYEMDYCTVICPDSNMFNELRPVFLLSHLVFLLQALCRLSAAAPMCFRNGHHWTRIHCCLTVMRAVPTFLRLPDP
jgi:hypothetical protein